jgi:hypothetical protein
VRTERRPRTWLIVLALIWCSAIGVAHALLPGLACYDNANCAQSYKKDGVYYGVLRDRVGRLLTNTRFGVGFGSPNAKPPGTGGFATNSAGRYCVVWASYAYDPAVFVAGRTVATMNDWHPLDGRTPPHSCERGNGRIPWNRADDTTSSPQYRGVLALLVTTLVLLLGAVLPTREPAASRVRLAGLALTAASTLTTALVWLV